MKSLAYDRNGEPWDELRLVERPQPRMDGGMVLVRLEATPVHIADLKAIRGELPFVPPGPGVPGFEGVGRIIDCAHDVTGWAPGDRVILPMAYGAWSEVLAIRPGDLWRAPEGLRPEQLALVRINLSTAYLLLHAYARLERGDWIVQNAANSNVAHYVAQLAASAGINVVDVVRRPELVAPLEGAGRRHVLVDGADIAARIVRIAESRPCLALDAIGGTATTRLGACVADDGCVLAYGFLAEQPYALAYADVMFRNVRLQGMMTDRAMDRIGAGGRATMVAVLQSVMASGVLDAEIAGIYAFEEIQAALRHAAGIDGRRAGKVILVPDKA